MEKYKASLVAKIHAGHGVPGNSGEDVCNGAARAGASVATSDVRPPAVASHVAPAHSNKLSDFSTMDGDAALTRWGHPVATGAVLRGGPP